MRAGHRARHPGPRARRTGLSSRLGQQFIVENQTGGSGALGTASVARAEPDGYTLLFTPALVLSVLPQARGGSDDRLQARFARCRSARPSSTRWGSRCGRIRRSSRWPTWWLRRSRSPAQLNYGHPGVLTIPHLAMEELQQTAGVDIKDIPFRTGPQSITELLGGRLDFVSLVMGTEVGQNIRVIGVFGEKRIATFPDVPTVKEQGYDVVPASFGGLLAPLSTPEPVHVQALARLCRDAAKDDIYVTTAKRAGQPDDLLPATQPNSGSACNATSRARRACCRG